MKSTVGLSNFVIAPLTTDTEAETTYGTVVPVVGAIDVSVTPDGADPNIQHADDIEFDVLYPDPQITVSVEVAALPLEIQAQISGHEVDDNGVMVKIASDTPPYYAIGFKAERRGGGDRYKWLLKCRAKPITETFHSKEGSTVTRQTGKVEFTAIKRTSDGQYEYTADVGEKFTTAKAATFLATVYEPTFTPGP